MTSALRWAAKRAILVFHYEVMDTESQSQDSVHKPQPFTFSPDQYGPLYTDTLVAGPEALNAKYRYDH